MGGVECPFVFAAKELLVNGVYEKSLMVSVKEFTMFFVEKGSDIGCIPTEVDRVEATIDKNTVKIVITREDRRVVSVIYATIMVSWSNNWPSKTDKGMIVI